MDTGAKKVTNYFEFGSVTAKVTRLKLKSGIWKAGRRKQSEPPHIGCYGLFLRFNHEHIQVHVGGNQFEAEFVQRPFRHVPILILQVRP
jgi:hypothetical protein